MKENLSEIHAEIAEIQARDREGITKMSLREISEIVGKRGRRD